MRSTGAAPGSGGGGAGPVAEVTTSIVPEAERFGWWTDMVADQVMPVSVRSPHAAVFRGRAAVVDTPRAQVAAFGFSPMTARRSAVQIRRHDPECYFLVLVRDTPIRLEQARSTAFLEAGDLALFSTSQPLDCDFLDAGRQTRLTLIRLPRHALPLDGDRADRLLARPISGRTGAARLLGGYLTGLPDAARTSDPGTLERLGDIGVDLAATVLAAQLGDDTAVPGATRKAVLLARVRAFIERHLGEPGLNPAAIAAHHHISVRALHELFRGEPESVAASIRTRRLARCRADLTDSALRDRTIAEIAARWALRPGDFSRAFRSVYGMTPGELRAVQGLQVLPGGGGGAGGSGGAAAYRGH
ncbi:helix-turn-helix domain-containing protein [Yinghuangia soli]|uniref:Helix-turn-helix domain-containing protein n=1 Tax=Yinghuangia soli TaxID=2908204 RepID=A0AA41Q8L1_9ACTN|nr:helix-turn-helix domain-containing protein [Yinghuangia soli]MCF2532197.1 helix-turn-helix domain-containing protein [Yinghuangia soli]